MRKSVRERGPWASLDKGEGSNGSVLCSGDIISLTVDGLCE